MKKIFSALFLFVFMSNMALADCDWTTINKMPNGNFEYSPALNICVGQLVQDSGVKDQQVADLNKAIQLKDLALQVSDTRITLWQKSANDEMDRLNTIQSDSKKSDWLYFALGVGTTFLAGYMASRLMR